MLQSIVNAPLPTLLGGMPSVQADQHADAFRSLFDRSGICMATVDTTLRIQEANEQF